MTHTEHLSDILVLLGSGVCFVALLKLLRLSPLLGYLAAGMMIGPHGLGVVENVDGMAFMGELGVVFLMFIIGLELSLSRLKRMREHMFSFGALQVLLTTLLLGALAVLAGLSPATALVLGGGLALSSTAVVMQLLGDSGEKSTQVGRLSIATLILQDIAVIPLLVLIPVLAQPPEAMAVALGTAAAKAAVGVILIYAGARLLLKPAFRLIAAHGHQELFAAASLVIVLGMAYGSTLAGMSPALGAFLGGLLIAETEFRPQVEADILPFKSLLLGLFFITVGMQMDMAFVLGSTGKVLGFTLLLITVKAAVIFSLARLFSYTRGSALQAALLLAQGGEFAFVFFAMGEQSGVLASETAQLALACVTFSMALTPLLAVIGRRLADRHARRNPSFKPMLARETLDLREHVIIAGFGRSGRVIALLLEAERIPYVALDMDGARVAAQRAETQPVYYGDAGRAVVLKAVGIQRAQCMVIAHSDQKSAMAAIAAARSVNPTLPIIARAHSVEQVMKLEAQGANLAVAEMMETSLQLGAALLRQAGVQELRAHRLIEAFRANDYALVRGEADGTGTAEYAI